MRKKSEGFTLLFGYLGLFLIFEGIVMLVPLLMIAFYPAEWQGFLDFLIPGGAAIVLGFILYLIFGLGREKGRFGKNEDSLLLVLIWLFAIVLGALPFYLTKFPSINFGNADMDLGMSATESVFECISGLSTVGLSAFPEKAYLVSVEGIAADTCSTYPAAHLFLFHRAWLQFIGGIGLVLLVTSIISSKNNFRLYFAEGHNDRVVPNLAKSAKIIFSVYASLVLFGSLSLWLSGLSPFDAFCHSAAAVATGGFSTRSANLYFYSQCTLYNGVYQVSTSVYAELISCVLMLAGATNFLLHVFAIKGRVKEVLKDIEIRLAFVLFLVFAACTSLSIIYLYDAEMDGLSEGLDLFMSFRYGIFMTVSSLSTTGLSNFASAKALGSVTMFSSFILMTVGGAMGSTAGGIKQYRVALLLKEFRWSLRSKYLGKNTLMPRVVYRFGEMKEVDQGVLDEANHFSFLYILVFAIGALSLMFFPGVDFLDAFYEFMTAFTSLGVTCLDLAAYKASHDVMAYNGILWILSAGMFLGRLEILPMYYAFRRVFVDPIAKAANKRKRAKRPKEA